MLCSLFNEVEEICEVLLFIAKRWLVLNSCNPVLSEDACRCTHGYFLRHPVYPVECIEDELTIPSDLESVNREMYVFHFLWVATLPIVIILRGAKALCRLVPGLIMSGL